LIQIQSLSGLNIHLHASSLKAAGDFASALNSLSDRGHPQQAKSGSDYQTNVKSAFEVLDVSVGATFEEIVAAYRQMAKMYHPDRLAHLAPEFVELAEVRMKEINAAFDVLKRTTSSL
jgi:DnaJ like chaperone protein